jgi:hypothetical protein
MGNGVLCKPKSKVIKQTSKTKLLHVRGTFNVIGEPCGLPCNFSLAYWISLTSPPIFSLSIQSYRI